MAGFGGAIRKYKGEIIHLFYGNIGFNSNNAAELEGMIAGLTIVDNNSILPVIVEGDSAIVLTLAAKLLHGTSVSKVTTSWRLDHGISCLDSLLQRMHTITFHHMRKKANALRGKSLAFSEPFFVFL